MQPLGLVCRYTSLFVLGLATLIPAQRVPDTRLDTDAPGSGDSEDVRIAASGSSVHVAWEDDRRGNDIRFNRSLDHGATWLAADLRLNSGSPAGQGQAEEPAIAAVGSSVYVVWEDYRSAPAAGDIYFNRSTDGGATWLPAGIRLDSSAVGNSVHPEVAAIGTAVYVVWGDTQRGFNDVYFNRSLDGGVTWLPTEVRLTAGNAGPFPGLWKYTPHLAAVGQEVHVVWQDRGRSDYRDIRYNRSLDQGTTWLAAAVRINGSEDLTVASSPTIAASATSVQVVWEQGHFLLRQVHDPDIFAARSLDRGDTWSTPVRVDQAYPAHEARSTAPRIALAGSSVYVAWEEWRNGSPDIYFNRSTDEGQTWGTGVRLNVGDPPGASLSNQQRIVGAGDHVWVAWRDNRNGSRSDVMMNRSLDGGVTWLTSEQRLNTGGAPGTTFSSNPVLAEADGLVYAAWQDGRASALGTVLDVYFNVPFGMLQYGAGKAGSGGFVPALGGEGVAVTSSPIRIDLTNGPGGAAGAYLLGGAGARTAVPLLGGTLLVAPTIAVPAMLDGASGAPGVGSAQLPIVLPGDPSIIGEDLYFQGVVLDPAASFGVTFTNGVELWIG